MEALDSGTYRFTLYEIRVGLADGGLILQGQTTNNIAPVAPGSGWRDCKV